MNDSIKWRMRILGIAVYFSYTSVDVIKMDGHITETEAKFLL